jgi:negative regulator of flagellin synthesis FlgM
MRIAGSPIRPDTPALTSTSAATGAEAASPAGAEAPAAAAAPPLQSSVLKPAQAALAAMPDIDQAKVDAVRDALARGEVRFDAGRLAALIERFHGGHS